MLVRCADDRADAGVAVFTHDSFAPVLAERAHGFVNGLAAFHFLILHHRRTGWRSSRRTKSFILRFANAEQRLDAVRAEVAIHGQRVRTEGFRFSRRTHPFAEVRRGVGFHLVPMSLRLPSVMTNMPFARA